MTGLSGVDRVGSQMDSGVGCDMKNVTEGGVFPLAGDDQDRDVGFVNDLFGHGAVEDTPR